MVRIRGPVVILQVAGHAGRTIQAVIVVDVAIRAYPRRHHVRAGQRKSCAGVIENSVGPLHRVVAGGASRWKRRGDVIDRRQRGVVVLLMAAHTSGGQRGVVVVGVAVGACPRRHHVRTRERERRVVVIESRVGPQIGVVAGFARCRETRMGHRRGCAIEILLMARNA